MKKIVLTSQKGGSGKTTLCAHLTDGHSAPELAGRGQAAQEIAGLWRDVKSCFNENNISLNKLRSVANG